MSVDMGVSENDYFVVSKEVASQDMKTYRVTLKLSDAKGEPIVVEVQGNSHKFVGGESLNVYAEPGEHVAVFPAGEFAAVEIASDGADD